MKSRRSKASPGFGLVAAADEDLPVDRLARLDLRALRQAGIVGRHGAPAEELLSLFGDDALDDRLEVRAQRLVAAA